MQLTTLSVLAIFMCSLVVVLDQSVSALPHVKREQLIDDQVEAASWSERAITTDRTTTLSPPNTFQTESSTPSANLTSPPIDCENGSADLVFVVDASGSIGMGGFQRSIDFIKDIVQRISIGLQDNLIGIILFGNKANLHFDVQAHADKIDLLAAIDRLRYYDENTNTAAALSLLLSSAQDGTMRLRPGHSHIAIFISDGHDSTRNVEQTIPNAERLHATNIFQQVYAVNVNDANTSKLEAIASDPSLIFYAYSFYDAFDQLEQDLFDKYC